MFGSHSLRWLFVLTVPILAASTALAQLKVGVVGAQAALADTAEIKKAQADLEAKFKPRQDQMSKLSKELESINSQLSLGDKLTIQAQADLTLQGQRKSRELQRLNEDLQAEVDRERGDIIARSAERMRKVIEKLAQEKGLDFVVEAGTTLYAKPELDLTKEATAAYDKAHPAK
jgi:outer membrane protein